MQGNFMLIKAKLEREWVLRKSMAYPKIIWFIGTNLSYQMRFSKMQMPIGMLNGIALRTIEKFP